MIKNIKKILFIILLFINVSTLFSVTTDTSTIKNTKLSEIWAYVMPGEESNILGTEPITDLCYFTGSISFNGKLSIKSKFPTDAKKPRNARMHLVIADTQNKSLIHFLISPEFPLLEKFLQDLSLNINDYDGVQIDFESIDKTDKENFLNFLKKIKSIIGSKILSVALPARFTYKDDSFSYDAIAPIVDKIFIMAYDEHWKDSKPGPVASIDWCSKVAKYTTSVIPAEKLVMGMPFYGRSWQDKKNDRAFKFTTIQNMLKDKFDIIKNFDGANPGFEYTDTVKVTLYYDTPESLMSKIKIYYETGIKNIGFWRIGQESKEIWDLIDNFTNSH